MPVNSIKLQLRKHRIMRSKAVILLTLLFAGSVAVTHAQESAEAIRQQRRAAAQPTELLSPGLMTSQLSQNELLVVSRVSHPLSLEIAVLDSEGHVLPLGEFRAEPRDYLLLPLTEQIRLANPEFEIGSVRVSYLGDPEMLQAWLLTKQGPRVTELQLQSPISGTATEFVTFWDSSMTRGAKARVFLLNADSSPMTIDFVANAGHKPPVPRRWLLEPGQSIQWTSQSAKGWARISHDGQPGKLLKAGLIAGPQFLGSLPIFETEVDPADPAEELSLHSLPVPIGFRNGNDLVVALFNDSSRVAQVGVTAQAAESGGAIFRETLTLPPDSILTVPIGEQSTVLDPRLRQEARVTVSSDNLGLKAYGFSISDAGDVVDLVLFPRHAAHDGGIYPLFPLESHETFTNLVNLGSEESTIVAQFWWSEGTYSFGPVTIPPGSSYRIDVRDIVQRQEPDLLGRTLAPNLRGGLFRWRVHDGSRSLIGRTEIHQRDNRDTFGLNCLNCCFEMPRGAVVPGVVEFFPGQTPTFESCIFYDTCIGTEGPFPTIPDSVSSPLPFTWNGSNIAASDAARDNLSFTKIEDGLTLLCTVQQFEIQGTGTGDTCKELLRKPHNPGSLWSASKKCTVQLADAPGSQRCALCRSCCDQILAWKTCTKTGLTTANSEHQACLVNCATELGCNY